MQYIIIEGLVCKHSNEWEFEVYEYFMTTLIP